MPNRFDAIRAVLFDAVGTVMRPEPSVAAAYQQVGRRFGSTLTTDVIDQRFRIALANQYRSRASEGESAGADLKTPAPTNDAQERQRWQSIVKTVLTDIRDPEGAFELLWDHFGHSRNWILFDDVHETWTELERRGFVLGIASNFDSRLIGVCAAHDPLRRTPHVFYSSRIGYPKPSPHFFRAIEVALELHPNQLLLVGDDRENDLEGARAAGWQALLLDRQRAKNNGEELSTLRVLTKILAGPSDPSRQEDSQGASQEDSREAADETLW